MAEQKNYLIFIESTHKETGVKSPEEVYSQESHIPQFILHGKKLFENEDGSYRIFETDIKVFMITRTELTDEALQALGRK